MSGHPSAEAITALSDVSSILYEDYRDGFWEQFYRHAGRVTNKLFRADKMNVGSDGINYKFMLNNMNGVRIGADPLSDFPSPGSISAAELKIRYAEGNVSGNDFRDFKGTIQTSFADLKRAYREAQRGNVGAVIDLAATLQKQLVDDFSETIARFRHLPSDAKVAQVNGSLKKNDRENYSDAGAHASPYTSARMQIDSGAIAMFQPGTSWVVGTSEVYFTVTDYNPTDSSIGVTVDSDSPTSAFNSTANTYDNMWIYPKPKSGTSKSTGMYGLASWYGTPSVGETWLGGVDRTSTSWRHLLPTRYTPSSSTVAISKDHFDHVATISQYVRDENYTPVVLTHTSVADAIRRSVGYDTVTFDNPDQSREFSFGTPGLYWFHPALGRVRIESDTIASPNRVYIIIPQTWDSLMYGTASGSQPFEYLPGSIAGIWQNMQSTTPGGGASMFFRASGVLLGLCDACRQPRLNMSIENIKAA